MNNNKDVIRLAIYLNHPQIKICKLYYFDFYQLYYRLFR